MWSDKLFDTELGINNIDNTDNIEKLKTSEDTWSSSPGFIYLTLTFKMVFLPVSFWGNKE